MPGQQFEYNVKNELVRLHTDAGLVADYSYDHLGMRMSKRVDDGNGGVRVTHYVGDQAEIRDGVASHFVTIGGLRCAVLTGDHALFLHDSPTGSSSFFTDSTRERVGELDYEPFGNEASRSDSVDFQTYSLHPVDPESGLAYMRRRYYCPAIGRFLTPDLMALYQPENFIHAPAGLHLYAFVANDPMNKTDEDGLSFWSFVGSVVGVIVGVVVALLIIAAVVATGGIAGVLLGIGLVLAASLTVTGISYIVASNVNPNSAFGQFMRGFMIGFNAGMNATIATALFGPVVGIALGVINFLATFEGVSRNSTYQGILGWTSWLMPMSWGGDRPGADLLRDQPGRRRCQGQRGRRKDRQAGDRLEDRHHRHGRWVDPRADRLRHGQLRVHEPQVRRRQHPRSHVRRRPAARDGAHARGRCVRHGLRHRRPHRRERGRRRCG
jgi:RHS repeat-associated protein